MIAPMVSKKPPREETDGHGYSAGIRSHREIAAMLGIGRARVFYHEQCALKKLTKLFNAHDMATLDDFFEKPLALRPSRQPEAPSAPKYSPANGWLKVSQIISINGGSTTVNDVVRAYIFLKEGNQRLVRPPLLVSTPRGTISPYTIEAVTEQDDTMSIRCWPVSNQPRTLKHLDGLICTAIVQSEFGKDDLGQFDIPILLCTIVSARQREF